MKKRLFIWLTMVSLPFLIMAVVNASMPKPDYAFQKEKCSRYCHDRGCPHATFKKDGLTHKIYVWNIRALKNNGLGLSYAEANILIYVILFPLLMAGLLWKALPKSPKNE